MGRDIIITTAPIIATLAGRRQQPVSTSSPAALLVEGRGPWRVIIDLSPHSAECSALSFQPAGSQCGYERDECYVAAIGRDRVNFTLHHVPRWTCPERNWISQSAGSNEMILLREVPVRRIRAPPSSNNAHGQRIAAQMRFTNACAFRAYISLPCPRSAPL